MNTIALRYANNFAPEGGTILAHEKLLVERGFVWYGKLGSRVSKKVIDMLMKQKNPKILLIHSGKFDRYWAYINDIQYDTPELECIPSYYRKNVEDFSTWFKITKFEKAPNDVMGNYYVASSKEPLSSASKHSMSPYFIIKEFGD